MCGLPLVLPSLCKACDRNVPAGAPACLYCGMPVERAAPAGARDALCMSCGKRNSGSEVVCLYCRAPLVGGGKCKTCGRDLTADGSACR